MKNFFNNKVILITGGTGSFGQKFCKRILENYYPKKIIIYSRDELKQYEMSLQLEKYKKILRFFVGDIRDLDRLKFASKNVDYLIHAAALKQVDTAEYNPFEVIKTNILGTQNVIDAIIHNKVKRSIALSTDKAAAPINLYGSTKLAADKIFTSANNYSEKELFSVVRYGNVMLSRGSVVQLFLEQQKQGKKLTITDPEMTRFSITLEQGVDFVIFCLKKMWGSEIFVPKIPSYRIVDVAKAVAEKSKFIITGIRPGEKIHEEMITVSDSISTLEFKDYYVILPSVNKYLKWNIKKFIRKSDKSIAKFCKKDFSYNSKDNSYLSVEQIRRLINQKQ